MPREKRAVSLWIHFNVCSNKAFKCSNVWVLAQKTKNSFHWILCSRRIFTCLQSNHGSRKQILHIVHWHVFKSWGKAPAVSSRVSSLSHMCALGVTVYRRAGVSNPTVFWVVVAVFKILTWVVTPWATNHHRAAKKTKGWTDPASIQRESERHQAIFVKHTNREPHRGHHPTQSWKQEEGCYNGIP